MATLRATNRENRKEQLELPAVTRWAGTLHMSTLPGQMNMTTLTGYTARQQHLATLHMTTLTGHTARANNNWAQCTFQMQV